MPTLTTLLVGAQFRSGAREFLAQAPAGLQLQLQPDPDNQYDPHAVQVWTGVDFPLWLGFLPTRKNKQLLAAPDYANLSCNEDFAKLVPCTAQLLFGPNGEPRVRAEVPNEG